MMLKRLLSLAFVFVVGCSATAPNVIAPPAVKEGAAMVPDPEPPMPVYVEMHADTAFTIQERADLQMAVSMWKIQTSGLADINLMFDMDFNSVSSLAYHQAQRHHTIRRLESWMPLVKHEDDDSKRETGDQGSIILGECIPDGGIKKRPHGPVTVLLVADRFKPYRAAVQVPMHEFGHVLGLPHVKSDRDAIMYPSHLPKKHVCLRAADLLAFCAVNDCGSVQMYPCSESR